jgi:hypothetical protein
MESNELRIGNLVKWYDVSKVLELHSEKNEFDNVYIECEESFEWTEYDKLIPIELTEEWLLKFGFISNPYQDRYEKDIIRINCNKIKGFTELWIDGMPHIKYIHQLQNLYFALTGEELKIKEQC